MSRKGNGDWDWEKKPKRVEKGTNKSGKHRKSIYNMLTDYDEDYTENGFNSDDGDVSNYDEYKSYKRIRR